MLIHATKQRIVGVGRDGVSERRGKGQLFSRGLVIQSHNTRKKKKLLGVLDCIDVDIILFLLGRYRFHRLELASRG